MTRKQRMQIKTIARRLVKGKPLAYALREDGTLVVIGPAGRKYLFDAEQVRAAQTTGANAGSAKSRGGA